MGLQALTSKFIADKIISSLSLLYLQRAASADPADLDAQSDMDMREGTPGVKVNLMCFPEFDFIVVISPNLQKMPHLEALFLAKR